MTLILDHVLMGAPDLDVARAAFAKQTGVEPSGGGSHDGFGTRNQLASLGSGLFFEIIAPDPDQASSLYRATALAGLAAAEMHTFCMRTSDIAGTAERAAAAGIKTSDPVRMGRTRADGVRLEWEILYLATPEWGDALPFLIDWRGSQHPAETSPVGCAMAGFTVLHPRAQVLRSLYRAIGVDVPVKGAMRPGFLLELDTPKGAVALT